METITRWNYEVDDNNGLVTCIYKGDLFLDRLVPLSQYSNMNEFLIRCQLEACLILSLYRVIEISLHLD